MWVWEECSRRCKLKIRPHNAGEKDSLIKLSGQTVQPTSSLSAYPQCRATLIVHQQKTNWPQARSQAHSSQAHSSQAHSSFFKWVWKANWTQALSQAHSGFFQMGLETIDPAVVGNKLKLERISYEQDILLLDKKTPHCSAPAGSLNRLKPMGVSVNKKSRWRNSIQWPTNCGNIFATPSMALATPNFSIWVHCTTSINSGTHKIN